MAGGSWSPTALPVQPGLYVNFVSAAVAQIKGGTLGTVAIPLATYAGGTAVEKTFYTVTNESDAGALFDSANIQSIKFALQGGAKDVLVYTLPVYNVLTADQDYADMRTAYDTRPFNVFVFDGNDPNVTAAQQDSTLTWVNTNKSAGKHFMAVFGAVAATAATDDATPATGNTRTTRLLGDYVVNLINGVTVSDTDYTSHGYAAFVAGLIAGTAINKSTTYAPVPVDDVTKRMTNTEINTALTAGSFVLINDGRKVKVVQGLTTSVKKIRRIRAEQAVSNDITTTASDSYIGKIDNNDDGQAALIAAIKTYLETLQASNVLTNPTVSLDPQYLSTGDSVYLAISYTEVDSMERIFITINV